MDIPQNLKVRRAYWFVLSQISTKQGLNPSSNRIVDYYVDLNVGKIRGGITSIDEINVLKRFEHEGFLKEIRETDIAEVNERFSDKYKAFEVHHLEITDSFEKIFSKFKKSINREVIGDLHPKGLLQLKQDGNACYISPSLRNHAFKFGVDTNQFKLLDYLVKKSGVFAKYDELSEILKTARNGADSSGAERRVLDTVKAIRKNLQLVGDEMIVVDYGVKLDCDIQINQ